ncbi:MAG: response regulator [Gammaproteobacteria bacterium]|nr:response regulator [Gammaproteobacteria bacterium]MBV8403607.1 response regulator [Gammaproteobacteria bacterium]
MDDSKSARLFLARVLEKYEIDVDSAETAEAAIDYLSSNRPDVIFMDHLMPGMDGLQAVRAIKNDPRTATIPIMMYTSQEGEVYLGQARALGALGVLPKQIKPTDVSKVLYQLHLVPDRRTNEQSSFTAVDLNGPQEPPAGAPRVLTDTTLREHFAELRRALVAGVDTQTDRITAEVRALLLESLPPPAPPPTPETLPTLEPPRGPAIPWPWVAAGAALVIALASMVLAWRSVLLLGRLEGEVARLQAQALPAALAGAAHAAAPSAQSPPGDATGTDSKPIVVPVPYGAEPLGGARLDIIRQQLYRLARQKGTGVAEIRTFAGRFCLIGSPVEGYSPAPEETLVSRCDLLGNPSEEAFTSQRTPLPLVNLIGDIRNSTHGAFDVQITAGDPASVLSPYPPAVSYLTAGEWNRAAMANNRVEIRVR